MLNFKQEAERCMPQLLEDLKALLKIESVRDDEKSTPAVPFGPGPKQALDAMLALGARDGFKTKNVANKAGVVSFGEGPETLGILAHLDVVPATGHWTTPPFQPDIRNGCLYARGASDDKGPALACYYALKILKEAGLPFYRRVDFIFGTDEESDWRCLTRYFETEPMPDLGFSPDADFPLIHAEKGMLNLIIQGGPSPQDERAALQVLRFQAGNRANMVPETASVEICGSAEARALLLEHWGDYTYKADLAGKAVERDDGLILTLYGQSAHGAEPELGKNAATFMAHFLLGEALPEPFLDWCHWILAHLHLDTAGRALGMACEDDVMGALTVNAGIFSWTPEKSSILLNIRHPMVTDGKAIQAALKDALQHTAFSAGEPEHVKPPHYIPKDDPLVTTLLAAYAAQSGLPAQALAIGGATYSRMMPRCVAFGAQFPNRPSTMHQADEYIRLDDLRLAVAIYADAIYRLACVPFPTPSETGG